MGRGGHKQKALKQKKVKGQGSKAASAAKSGGPKGGRKRRRRQ